MCLLMKIPMKIKQTILSGVLAFASLAALAPTIASAAPHRHNVCHWDRQHAHLICQRGR